ncbi:MAG: hypothetical protein P8X60_04170 [Robiginitalea sp.]|jgi:hypothetical protein
MSNLLRKAKRNSIVKGKYSRYLLYAIGEFLLLIFGILIALQVDNWNEDRKERMEEVRILEQLVEDFNTNKLIINNSDNEYKRVLRHIDAALRHTGPRVTLPPSAVFDSIDNLWTPTVELLHTNASAEYGLNLEPVTNNQLKLAVMAFPATFSQYKELENTLKDLTGNQHMIRQKYIPLIANEQEYGQDMFESDSLGLIRDREFQNASVDRLWNTQNAKIRLEWLSEHNDTILKLLNAELLDRQIP